LGRRLPDLPASRATLAVPTPTTTSTNLTESYYQAVAEVVVASSATGAWWWWLCCHGSMGEREDYYDRRAAEYDETVTDGVDAETAAAFARELAALGRVLKALPAGRVLDVACGTGLFAQYLRGAVVALDRSERMLKIARTRIPAAQLVRAGVPPPAVRQRDV
jgi:2-polyprenyl-3-methyl-5-hydroxy-6-metoxy-1,4-benzoquinol methylase